MTRLRRRAWLGVASCALLLTSAACADDPEEPRSASEGRTEYLLLEQEGWELQEAIDYRAGLGRIHDAEPHLDWFAEYDGPRRDLGDGSYTVPHVVIQGHTAGLEGRRDELREIEFREREIDGRAALEGQSLKGQLLLVHVRSDYSVGLWITDGPVDLDLLFRDLVPVDEDGWVAAGGTLLDCVPFEPGCSPED